MDMFFAKGDHLCVVYASLLTAAGPDVRGTHGDNCVPEKTTLAKPYWKYT